LYRVASDLARIVPRDDTLPYAPVEFALSHHGIIEPTPAMLVTFAHAAEPTTIAEVFGPRLAKLLAGGEYSRIGMGTVQRDGGQDATVVLLQKSFIETEPIPRVLRAGSSFRLRGRLLGAFRSPRVVVTREDGVVEQRPVKRG